MIQEDAIKTFEKAPQEKALDTVFFRALKAQSFAVLQTAIRNIFTSIRTLDGFGGAGGDGGGSSGGGGGGGG
ncbi:hypothetical protein HZH66_010249 [Vespula vulgaris]|uniref:Uncharacterized protein n=1 Tax=Vespula vulgaris TaxID=7454 RepID=A0A834JL40_VESVU|nr:hypothetical protein HZH66_010249 [Vespula vulgaris]